MTTIRSILSHGFVQQFYLGVRPSRVNAVVAFRSFSLTPVSLQNKMAVNYKLHYFNGRGAGEVPRLILAHAKIPFEDVRCMDYEKDWPKIKDSYPWAQLPVLDVDGNRIAQSKAIICFLSRRYGLDGENEFDKAKCEEYLGAAQDLQQEFFKYFDVEKDKQPELLKKASEATGRYLSKFEGILQKQGNGFLVGGKLTYADIFLAELVSWIQVYFKDTDAAVQAGKFPVVKKHMEMVEGRPGIKEWIGKREKTEF